MSNTKHGPLPRCPLCGCTAHIAEVVLSYDGKTLAAVACDNRKCRLSEVPPSWLCHPTEAEAIDEWAGYPRAES